MVKSGEDARMAYLQSMVEGASREDLLLMLLDGALRFTNKAEVAFGEEKWDEAHNQLCRVQNIFLELMLSLDSDQGEEIVTQLNDIYGFINTLLVQANVDRDGDALDQAKALILEVKGLWEDTIEKARGTETETGVVAEQKPSSEKPKSINITG